jgi:adenylylsulfate kinase-like enzyme
MRQDDYPQIIVITGIMASGKSTVAELLVRRFPRSVHLRGDLFRRLIVNGRVPIRPGFPDDDALQLRLRHRLTAQAADTYAREGSPSLFRTSSLASSWQSSSTVS